MNAEQLRIRIIECNEAYRKVIKDGPSGHVKPLVSDAQYDIMLGQYAAMVTLAEFEEFRRSLMEDGGDVKHKFVVGSLNKLRFGEDELWKWVKKYLVKNVFWSFKLDGMSFVAEYFKGRLIHLTTRGDGLTGESLDHKMKYIDIPQTLPDEFTGTVRGELVLCGDSHTKLGMDNRRNGVVGVVKEKKIVPAKLAHVKAYAYQILESTHNIFVQYSELLTLGFTIPPNGIIPVTPDLEDLLAHVLKNADVPFDFDGLVISEPEFTNENVYYPERMAAFKVNSEGTVVEVLKYVLEVSRNRLLKPVVHIVPTMIDGAMVSKVTAHNMKMLIANGIDTGAVIKVIRSGCVIPKIVGVVKKVTVNVPAVCPECGHSLAWEGVDLQCMNEDCPAAWIKLVEAFIKRSGIENVSETTLRSLNIGNFDDLLKWIPKLAYKTQTAFASDLIKRVFEKPEEVLMRNLPCNGFGNTLFDNLSEHLGGYIQMKTAFATFKNTLAIIGEDYEPNLPAGIGIRTIEKALVDWERNLKIVEKIMADPRYGVPAVVSKPKPKQIGLFDDDVEDDAPKGSDKLAGKTFCITGTLVTGTKEKFYELIELHGGKNVSMKKGISYLICGMDSWGKSIKYQKAVKDGITVIREEEFMRLID